MYTLEYVVVLARQSFLGVVCKTAMLMQTGLLIVLYHWPVNYETNTCSFELIS
jgi:hypothetical protein